MFAPRLVATDLDGTIVRSDRTISTRTAGALARVERAGAELVFVTGRPPRWLPEVAAATGHHGMAICGNGAVLYDMHEERVVEIRAIEESLVRELVRLLRAALPDLAFAVERSDGFLREVAYDHHEHAPVIEQDVLHAQPAVKLLAQHPELDADALLDRAHSVIGRLAEVTLSGGTGLVELSASGVTKATTLARLCEQRGIAASEVVGFGDMHNDLPMLAWVGTAYAVANAHPDVLAAVPCHTASNDEDGVAGVLERLFPE